MFPQFLNVKDLDSHHAHAQSQHPEESDQEAMARAIARLAWKQKGHRRLFAYVVVILILIFCASKAHAQRGIDGVQIQNSGGSIVHGYFGGIARLKCSTNINCTYSGGVTTMAVSTAGIAGRPYVDVKADCGAAGDNVTDDGATINTCITNNQGKTIFFPKTQANGVSDYYSTVTIVPKGKGMVLMGAGSGWPNSNTSLGNSTIRFASNVQGVYMGLENCSGCSIKHLGFLGGNETKNLQTPTAFILPSAANLPHYDRNISSIQRTSNVLTVTVSSTNGGDKLTAQAGSTVSITGVVGDATMNGLCDVATTSGSSFTGGQPQTFTCAQNGADAGPFTSDGVLKLPTTGALNADGIRVCGNFYVLDNITVQGFARWGINADSTIGNGCNQIFSDDLVIRDSFITNNQFGGFFCNGADCNAGMISGTSFYYNGIIGAEDRSSLGNVWIGNQFSYNDYLNGTTASPATKNITSATRTSGTVAIVLASADTNIQLGACVVIAGVTDASFNTTAGQCFFVTSYTNSTHYSCIQPGNPGDATSSGGTSRMAKYGEATLSSGVFYGSMKVGFGSGASDPLLLHNYIEGGQPCAFTGSVIIIQGQSTPACAFYIDQVGSILHTQYFLAGGYGANITHMGNRYDGSYELTFHAGNTVSQHQYLTWDTYNSARAWRLDVIPTAGSESWVLNRGTGVRRFYADTSVTRIDSEGVGAVEINKNGGQGSGTAGLEVWSGGASPTLYGKINSSGIVLGTTTVASLPSAAANPGAMIRVSDSTSVSAEGQTCVGSSSNNALAFSNGSVWKCF